VPNYANSEVTFWWVTILVGFVVVLVAAALLQLLLSLVKDIDRGVEDVKATLAATAGNTAQSPLIGAVARGVDDILKEGLNHHLFLTRELVAAEAAGRGYRR
jgi:predicted permease